MKCSKCSADIQNSDNFCPVCGEKQQRNASIQEDNSIPVIDAEQKPAKKKSYLWPTLLAVVFFVIVLAVISSTNANNSQQSDNQTDVNSSEIVEEAPAPPPPWYPEGYQELTSNLAYQSLPVEQMNCGYSSAHTCYQIYLVSNTLCTAFINVNFLNNEVIIDSGIDSASITAGGQAILSFVSFTAARYAGDTKVQITDASCY